MPFMLLDLSFLPVTILNLDFLTHFIEWLLSVLRYLLIVEAFFTLSNLF